MRFFKENFMNIVVESRVMFDVTPVKGKAFSERFGEQVMKVMAQVGQKFNCLPNVTFDKGRVHIIFTSTRATAYLKLYDEVTGHLTVLSEHGRDSDLLNQLLERHPEVMNHPKVDRVIGAFQTFLTVMDEVAKDKSTAVKVEMERQEREGAPPLAEKLASEPTNPGIAARAAFRDQAMLGQAKSQIEERKDPPPPPPLRNVDAGNVFLDKK
jgi:hypothetical protein